MTRLTIKELGAQGDGLADHEDGTAYVPLSAPGDVVDVSLEKVGAKAWRGRIQTIIEPGAARRTPICAHFGACGGCTLQHINEDAYRDWKSKRASMALAHHGFADIKVHPAIISPTGSRRRIDLKFLRTKGAVLIGFHKAKSKQIVDTHECPVARPELIALIPPLRALLLKVLTDRQAGSVRLTSTNNGVAALIELPREPDLEAREALAQFADVQDLADLSIQIDGFEEAVARRRAPQINLGEAKVEISAGSFLQATAEGEAALQGAVSSALKDCKNVADLFAGLGTFSFPLAQFAAVSAVEGDQRALDRLSSAGHMPGYKAITAVHRDLFRRPLTVEELNEFDGVVFDPPRAGAQAQVPLIAKSNVGVVVAVSCNPNTFSRDARILVDGGYELQHVQPVDQFIYSPHVELVAVFTRPQAG